MKKTTVRATVHIEGVRIPEGQFSKLILQQPLGAHHNFDVRLRFEANKGILLAKSKEWIGRTITIGIGYQDDLTMALTTMPPSFQGIITTVALSRQSGVFELLLQGQSPTIMLDGVPQARSFTDKGLQEIGDEVMQEYLDDYAEAFIQPKSYTKVLPYIVQYNETNFRFLARLANTFGEWFFYDGITLYFGRPAPQKIIELDIDTNDLISFDLSVATMPLTSNFVAYDYRKNEPILPENPGTTAVPGNVSQVPPDNAGGSYGQGGSVTQVPPDNAGGGGQEGNDVFEVPIDPSNADEESKIFQVDNGFSQNSSQNSASQVSPQNPNTYGQNNYSAARASQNPEIAAQSAGAISQQSTNELGKIAIQASQNQVYNKSVGVAAMPSSVEKEEYDDKISQASKEKVSSMVVLTGASRNPKLKLGTNINVIDTNIAVNEDYGTYIITEITHEIAEGGDYINSFKALPIEVETPPANYNVTPAFCDTQLAFVTDINDEEGLGRVRVQFAWQTTEEKSPWIRVAMPYTGADKGFYFLPEIGDQVLVAFEQNIPEKPYVLTGMYHGDAKPENADPNNNFKSIKTRGKNEIFFDDTQDGETLFLYSPKNIVLQAGGSIVLETTSKEGGTVNINTSTTGFVTINKSQSITLEASAEAKIISEDYIQLVADKELEVRAAEKLHIISSGTLDVWSASSAELASDEDLNIQGKTIKLN